MRSNHLRAVIILVAHRELKPAAVFSVQLFDYRAHKIFAPFELRPVVVADNAVYRTTLHAAANFSYKIVTLSALGSFGALTFRKRANKLVCHGYGVYHFALGLPGVNVYALYLYLEASAVKSFIRYFPQLLAVDGVGKIAPEFFHVEQLCAVPYFLVGSKRNAYIPVLYFGVANKVFQQRHNLGDARLVIRAQHGSTVGSNNLLSRQLF